MNQLRNHLSLLLLFVFIFSVVGWKYDILTSQGSLVYANFSKDMSLYSGKSREIQRYNEAIFMTQKGDYTAAESLLSPLLNMQELTSPSDIYELYGDVLYSLQKPSDIIRVYYEKSLQYGTINLRVEKKIELLAEKKEASGSGQTDTGTGKSDSQSTESGSAEKSQKLEELKKMGQERGEYIDYNASASQEAKSLIQSSLDALEGKATKREW